MGHVESADGVEAPYKTAHTHIYISGDITHFLFDLERPMGDFNNVGSEPTMAGVIGRKRAVQDLVKKSVEQASNQQGGVMTMVRTYLSRQDAPRSGVQSTRKQL